MSFRDIDGFNLSTSTRFLDKKLLLVITPIAGLATLIFLVTGMEFPNADLAYGQFFENSGTKSKITNSSSPSSNSTSLENSTAAGLVLLRQKLNNASFGYRVLEGQIQNKGNNTAKSIVVGLTVYDKDRHVVGSEITYPHLRTLKPNLISTFKMTTSTDNFSDMVYYKISLEWKKPDGSKEYIENAKIYKK